MTSRSAVQHAHGIAALIADEDLIGLGRHGDADEHGGL
jgi:hypothetical protein